MATPRRLIHKLEPQHLAVLQYLDARLPDDDGPMPFIEELKIQNAVRFTEDMKLAPIDTRDGKRHGQRIAIGEHLHDMTYQLHPDQEPFVIIHARSGKHYGISPNGRALARKCTIKIITDMEGKPVPTVVDKAKGKPPVLQSIEAAARIIGDDEEDDDEPVRLPTADDLRDDSGHVPVITGSADLHMPDPSNEPEFERDTEIARPGTDEINDPPARGARARAAAPAPAATTKKKTTKKPAHTRAVVPGRD